MIGLGKLALGGLVALGLLGGDSGAAQVGGGGAPPGGGGGTPPGGGGGTPPLTGGGPGCPVLFHTTAAAWAQAARAQGGCVVSVVYRGAGPAFMAAAQQAQEVPGQPCTAIVATNDPTELATLPSSTIVWGVQALSPREDYEGFLVVWSATGTTTPELVDAMQEAMLQASIACGPLDGPGTTEPDGPEAPSSDDVIIGILAEHTADTPTPGMLYQIKPGENPTKVARAALGVGEGDSRTEPYVQSMVQSRYNWTLYASQPKNVQAGYYGGGQIGGTWADLSAAYLPMHERPRDAAIAGHYPRRRVSWSRGPNGEYFTRLQASQLAGPPSLGLIFLPELGPDGAPVAWDADDPEANPGELLAAFGVDVGELTEAVYA